MNKIRGFTVTELMVVVAIIGIIGAFAIPNVREMIATNRQLGTANLLLATFNHARNSAVTLSRDVQIDANGGNWKNGWTVTALAYTAMDVDGTINNYPAKILMVHEPLPTSMVLTSDVTSLQYNRQGNLMIAAAKAITVCDDRTGEPGRIVTLEPIGRVSITSASCP